MTTIRYQTQLARIAQFGNALEPNTPVAFKNVRASIHINQQHDCLQLKYFCLRVRPSEFATYLEENDLNNQMCIPVEPEGDVQLKCPYGKCLGCGLGRVWGGVAIWGIVGHPYYRRGPGIRPILGRTRAILVCASIWDLKYTFSEVFSMPYTTWRRAYQTRTYGGW